MGQTSSTSTPSYVSNPQTSILATKRKIRITERPPRNFRFANNEKNPNGTKKPIGTIRGYYPENSPSQLKNYNIPTLPQPNDLHDVHKLSFPPLQARSTVNNSVKGGARKTRRRRHSRK
jgi:hypothetical protein